MPKQLKGEIPTVEELAEELEKETIEFKENLSPVDARLQAIKEKLKGIKTDEIQTPATYPILLRLYKDGLRPLYEEIIKRLSVFEDEFHSKMFVWNCTNKAIVNLEQLDGLWKDEQQLKNISSIDFRYNFFGFKKAGTENFGENLELSFKMDTYWYGFTLVNHNEQNPFLKKLYHKPITKEDQQLIIDLLLDKVMDRIDWIIEVMKNRNKL